MVSIRFCFQQEICMHNYQLSCTFSVLNADSKEMAFSIGAHPDFVTPKIESCVIDFGKSHPIQRLLSDTMFDTGENCKYLLRNDRILDLNHKLFDGDGFFFQNVGTTVKLIQANGDSVEINCEKHIFWGIWHTPKTEASFVCIEPWYGIPGREHIVEDLSNQECMICITV